MRMKLFLMRLIPFACLFFGLVASANAADKKTDIKQVPTHADAAVILTKYSGLFDRYIDKDATLSECVSFLNEHGIYFGLLEVVNGKDFTLKDCARVMGQIDLVLSGEAVYVLGKVKLPKNIDTWEEFCIMSGVDYVKGYDSIVQAVLFAQK